MLHDKEDVGRDVGEGREWKGTRSIQFIHTCIRRSQSKENKKGRKKGLPLSDHPSVTFAFSSQRESPKIDYLKSGFAVALRQMLITVSRLMIDNYCLGTSTIHSAAAAARK
jgi:hypothetical protein